MPRKITTRGTGSAFKKVRRREAAGAKAGGARGRINWHRVLAQMPKQFKLSDVRSVRGLKLKRSSEIFVAIKRWIDAGLVTRKTRGDWPGPHIWQKVKRG
ncbi:MAG: hypothetical protein WA993_02910 [Candidatus Binatus sp.]|jgi:hypothetical protein